MKIHYRILFCSLTMLTIAEVSVAQKKLVAQQKQPGVFSNACPEPTSKVSLDINNVRAMMLGGADMWWDLNQNPRYEIPKGSGIYSIFAGALWIGAIDQGGQLRVAAQTYRQTGNDFWPGPMDTIHGTASDSAAWKYDRVWKVDRQMVKEFTQRYNDPSYIIPKDILEWPGNGDVSKGQAKNLAPYVDKNGDGKYNARDGDYPAYNFTGNQNCEHDLLGDQTLWWIFNDVCDFHGETGGAPLGLEIQAQAFSYKTNDEINDATFYQYKVINRSANRLDSMYWGQWIDTDLGEPTDDYVACDVKRGLGYTYNSDNDDSPPIGYGASPPAIGCDFLGGPLADANDGVDNDRDSIIDEADERIMMSDFIYYDGGNNVPYTNPNDAQDFYYYLRSRWKDGTPMVYNGKNGYIGTGAGPACKFLYPKDSDPYGWGTGGVPQAPWDEVSADNAPQDRRFEMSAGPFTMQHGAVQYITHAVIWARDLAGDNMAAIPALQKADDKAQHLFDNCFNMPCYPPQAQIHSSAKELEVLFAAYCDGTTYAWDFGDGATSNLKYPEHTYAASGKYTVCLKVTNACGSDSTCSSISVLNNPPPPWGFRLKRIEGNGNAGRILEWLPENYDSVMAHGRVVQPVYEYLEGPVNVGVYDTTLLPQGQYIIKFNGVTDTAKWKMYHIGFTDTVFADSAIGTGYTQKIPQWGIQVQGKQVKDPGISGSPNNGFLEAGMYFSDPNKRWLTGLPDVDFPTYDNWIRAGIVTGGTTCQNDYIGLDSNEVYETILGGTWAPYRLCAASGQMIGSSNGKFDSTLYYTGPAFVLNYMSQPQMKDLASVDVIITSDRSKWTRCTVLEMAEDSIYTANTVTGSTRARKLDYRRAPSVDKNGNSNPGGSVSTNPNDPNYISPTGMGWFPGYAVNLETGERLNICFGENSALTNENGGDMLWNPTKNKYASTYSLPWDSAGQAFGSPVFGGQHYIYVFGHNRDNDSTGSPTPNDFINVPCYDAGKFIDSMLHVNKGRPTDPMKREVFRDAMWVNIPLLEAGQTLLSTDVKVRLRVSKSYKKGYSGAYYTDILPPPIGTQTVSSDVSTHPENNNNPMYGFDSHNFGLAVNEPVVSGQNLLFPNPFSHSATLLFENKRSEAHELKIFDIRGKVVREYKNLTGQSVIIEREKLNPGIYFYNLTSGGNSKENGKFIIVN